MAIGSQEGDDLDYRLSNPTESEGVEFKQWIDPKRPEGIEKIAKAVIALRNQNGGWLIFGFDDDLRVDPNRPQKIRRTYHPDVIQEIVTKYASVPFGIEVHFRKRKHDKLEFVAVFVRPGVESPVACKRDLFLEEEHKKKRKKLLRRNAIYVRSVQANNRVSTTEVTLHDLDGLVKRCFDNREADIAGFIRRHFADVLKRLRDILAEAT
ncbi:MAG: ATP-binding protein [Pirellulales bacterium]